MIDQNNIVELFPTPLYVVTDVLTEEENQELADHIVSVQDQQVGIGKNVWHSGEGSPKNSFGLNVKDKQFNRILGHIHYHMGQYINTVKADVNVNTMKKEWWWNLYQGHNYQEYHNHFPHLFSGVYYARIPEGSSDIKFRHYGWGLNIPHQNETAYNSDACK